MERVPSRRRHTTWLLAAGLGAALAAPGAAWAAPGDTELVSRATGLDGANSGANVRIGAISGDGRFVAFTTDAAFSPGDTNRAPDVYVRDVQASTTTLVSRADGAAGATGDDTSQDASISHDGRFVSFTSEATNLDPSDTDPSSDVFVRDLRTQDTTLVSRRTGAAGPKFETHAGNSALNGNGRYVAFDTITVLDPQESGVRAIFVRDLVTNTTTLVSRASGADGALPTAGSRAASISDDGQAIAFDSDARNLTPDDPSDDSDVFVRNLRTNTTTLVSRASGAAGAKGISSAAASISDNGRRVAFTSRGRLTPDLSAPGRDVYVRDLDTNTTTLVSRPAGTGVVGASGFGVAPSISGDGTSVAFDTDVALDPSEGDDRDNDVFLRDLPTNTTTLVSRVGLGGPKGDDSSRNGLLSDDGAFAAFDSNATNLTPADTDSSQDTFRKELSSPVEALDAYRPGTGRTPPTAVVGPVLPAGSLAVLRVQGTVSVFAASLMASPSPRSWAMCGTPENAPLFPTPGMANGRVGSDPEFLFAFPQIGTRCNPRTAAVLPSRTSKLTYSTDGGQTFRPLETLTPGNRPAADHAYTYLLGGQGHRLQVRFTDPNYADNHGAFRFEVGQPQ